MDSRINLLRLFHADERPWGPRLPVEATDPVDELDLPAIRLRTIIRPGITLKLTMVRSMTEARLEPAAELLAGLAKGLRHAGGLPLLGNRSRPGFFPTTAAGRKLASEARAAGLVMEAGATQRGKAQIELFALSVRGQELLETAADPRPMLAELLAAMRDRQAELRRLSEQMDNCRRHLEAAAERVQAMLPQVTAQRRTVSDLTPPAGGESEWRPAWFDALAKEILTQLQAWQGARPNADCPLGELFPAMRKLHPQLTVGQFHDVLRRLQAEGTLRLQPWTGPLAELPEPQLALLSGHAVMAYAAVSPSEAGGRARPLERFCR